MTNPTSGAEGLLSNIRVIESSLLGPGHVATFFADLGADVIKVESPAGDYIRQMTWPIIEGTSLLHLHTHRGKKSVTLNLRKDEGRALARRLIGEADVLIENFRPGTLEKWGLDPAALQEEHPDLIVVRISGYGQTGPYAAQPGYASVCEGFGGLRYVNGFPGGRPVRPNLSLGDTLSGMHAAFGVLLSVIDRDRRRAGGQMVDVGIFEAVYNLSLIHI